MIRRFGLFLLLHTGGLILIPWIIAQSTPLFQTTIYVEDAVGNRDSVTVGFDTLATSNIDPAFEEVELTSAFDSLLEVRAGTMDGFYRDKTSKTIIEWSERIYPLDSNHGCFASTRVFIYIWAKHQPVTIRWKKEVVLDDICVWGSLVSNHWEDEVAYPYDWEALPQAYRCMGVDSAWTLDVSAEAIEGAGIHNPIAIVKEVEGMGEQTVYGVSFLPSPAFTGWTPCSFVTENDEVSVKEHAELRIFPNPTDGVFVLDFPAESPPQSAVVCDIQGRHVKDYEMTSRGEIDLADLPAGIYFLTVKTINGLIYTQKIVKM